jgi:hypothetical protein
VSPCHVDVRGLRPAAPSDGSVSIGRPDVSTPPKAHRKHADPGDQA